MKVQIEAILAARLFVAPQLVGERLYFVSNLSGRLSLYAMDFGGSVPEPLLPPHLALQNPTLMQGEAFVVFPELERILVMLDQDGDEVYKPMLIPIDGGFPKPVFTTELADQRVNTLDYDRDAGVVYFWTSFNDRPLSRAYRADLTTMTLTGVGESMYGRYPVGASRDHRQTILADAYGAGDHVIFWKQGDDAERQLLYGVPLEEREAGQHVPPNSIGQTHFVDDEQALLFTNSIFRDDYGLGVLRLTEPGVVQPVEVKGFIHNGVGEMEALERAGDGRYTLLYNIDAVHWLYEGKYDGEERSFVIDHCLVGQGALAGGVLKGHSYDPLSDRHVVSFTTATSPTQLVTIGGERRDEIVFHTRERVLGVPDGALAAGEDASFKSYDGLRISARLYRPAAQLGYEGARPLVYYIHGGPQSQEHPDFAWFSMPLIQFLTLRGFAVFVPNARGSTGYGFNYMKHVIRDWGGADRLDHVHAMTAVLPQDPGIDVSRAGVVGRSYGGYMTLTLAARHPELWAAAVDMFGPYDLIAFAERVPETWKPFIALMVGDPETEADFLRERSPATYLDDLGCPLLVIQGKNDPRVVEAESARLVETLREKGKHVDYLMFADEGHDVLKYENRVTVYDAIVNFFGEHLT